MRSEREALVRFGSLLDLQEMMIDWMHRHRKSFADFAKVKVGTRRMGCTWFSKRIVRDTLTHCTCNEFQ